eukprot:66939-Hanusia_phi.AAC.2
MAGEEEKAAGKREEMNFPVATTKMILGPGDAETGKMRRQKRRRRNKVMIRKKWRDRWAESVIVLLCAPRGERGVQALRRR